MAEPTMSIEEARCRPLWTVAELHALIGRDRISERALYEAIRRGEFESTRIGNRIFVLGAPVLERWGIEATAQNGEAPAADTEASRSLSLVGQDEGQKL